MAVAVPWFYHRFDDEVRQRVEAKLAEQYPKLTVSVRSARLKVGEGIEIRGISIVEPDVTGPTAELAYIEELLLQGKTEWQELLQGEISIDHMIVRRPTVRVARRPDGSWSAAKLLPLPRIGKQAPRGVIENGIVELLDPSKHQGGSFVLRDMQLKFGPATSSAVTSPSKGNRPPIRLSGHFTGDHLQGVDLEATVSPTGNRWSIEAAVADLAFSPELVRALPTPVSRRLSELGSLRCLIKARCSLSRTAAQSPLAFELAGRLSRGRIDDPRLPYPLTDLQAAFHATPAGLTVKGLSARNGQTTLTLDFQREGYQTAGRYLLVAESRHMQFDQQLRSILPRAWQTEWQKFMPGGEFDAKFRLEFDGRQWQPHLVVICRDASFSYHKFPYRLERATGRIELKNHVLNVNLRAFSQGEQVRVTAEYKNPGAQARGWAEVRADNLRLDEKLFLALKDPSRRIVRSLNPRGTFNGFFRVWHGEEAKPVVHKHLELTLNRCSIRYDGFPYPIDNIRGAIVMDDDVWEYRQLTGTNDTGQISCVGGLTPTPAGNELTLKFTGEEVALEEELREALAVQSPGAARFWNDLRPRGSVRLEAVIRHLPGEKADTWVSAQPLYSDDGSVSVSIESTYFPYRLDKLRGEFTYYRGAVKFAGVRAEHRGTRLSAAGTCRVDGEGGWRLSFERIEADRLRADRDPDLVQALGGRLRRAITDLKPRGAFNLSGSLDLASSKAGAGLMASWKELRVETQGGSIDCGLPVENIFGGVVLRGSFDAERFSCSGDLAVDSLTLKQWQLTECLGPFFIDDRKVLLGRTADKRRGEKRPRHLTAKFYGGTLLCDGDVTLAAQPRYNVYASLADADLAQFAQESIAGRQRLVGRVSGDIDLHGAGRGLHNLGARGSLHLRNGHLYELPVVLALLKTLSGRPPDTTAFHTADVNFRVQGEHIYLNQISCTGDAISLRGDGAMGLDRSISLRFYAIVGRGDAPLPLLDKLLSAASQQIIQIRVDGTLDNPQPHNVVLPNVEEARRMFQIDPGTARSAPPPLRASYSSGGPR